MRSSYSGTPHSDEYTFDVELVDRLIKDMKHGKAACFEGITAAQPSSTVGQII